MTIYNCFCLDCGKRFKSEEEVNHECPSCESVKIKVLGQECGVFGKFSSMSPKDKQTVLKKRSNEHYKREIKEKKEYLDRTALGMGK